MKLQNNGPSVDIGNNDIFSKGEVREFDADLGAELQARYPFVSEVREVKVEDRKVAKESAIKRAIKKLKK
jgi:hypothetical protein